MNISIAIWRHISGSFPANIIPYTRLNSVAITALSWFQRIPYCCLFDVTESDVIYCNSILIHLYAKIELKMEGCAEIRLAKKYNE